MRRITGVSFTSVEICAGAGGQAIGLHEAGFEHLALVEYDADACRTLRHNGEPLGWAPRVHHADVRAWEPSAELRNVTLVSGGVPCPPFSIAGKQLGHDDERDLFPALIDLVETLTPRAVQAENVRGLLSKKFEPYRHAIERRLSHLGYVTMWRLIIASDCGVPQLRPRTIMVALRPDDAAHFDWPTPAEAPPPTVGQTLFESIAAGGWEGAAEWASAADSIAPTLVGGSRKHGGADLGPTRAKRAWSRIGVDGHGLANEVPAPGFVGSPKITVQQAALLQGFPPSWEIQGRKTSAYRQVGNALPPPVARAVGQSLAAAFQAADKAGLVGASGVSVATKKAAAA